MNSGSGLKPYLPVNRTPLRLRPNTSWHTELQAFR
jgi:hypothetical protein